MSEPDLLAAFVGAVDRARVVGPVVPDAQEPRNRVSEGPSDPPSPPRAQNRVPSAPTTYGCGGCDSRWGGVSRCHCSRCHRTLSGIGLFDAHQRDGKCLDPAAMDVRGEPLRLMNGVWCGPEMPADALARRRADQ